jgi:ribosome recycling factor
MDQKITEETGKNLEDAIIHFKEEIGKIRTGRASTALVENLMVDYYGSKAPVKQIASINVPEPRLITIQPWDRDSLVGIEAAIRESDLGLNPNNDGQIIRLNLPPLNEERRKDLVKVLNKVSEESRITIRNIREEVWKKIQKEEADGKISEDDKFREKSKLQEMIDEYNKKIEEIRKKKEEEIMTV